MTARLASLCDRMRRTALVLPRQAGRLAQPGRQWYKIDAADPERAIVQLDGEIGWDVVSSSFTRDLAAITAPAIDLQINSPGGSCWDGYAIYNAIKTHPATVTAHVMGVAASAASFIAMAADEIVAYRPSEMMIHDAAAWIDIWGMLNPADLATVLGELAGMKASLDQTSDEIAAIYARKAGPDHGTVAEWRERMRATTWYTPDTALADGLVDSIAGEEAADDSADNDTPAPGDAGATDAIERFRARARANIVRARHAARQTP